MTPFIPTSSTPLHLPAFEGWDADEHPVMVAKFRAMPEWLRHDPGIKEQETK